VCVVYTCVRVLLLYVYGDVIAAEVRRFFRRFLSVHVRARNENPDTLLILLVRRPSADGTAAVLGDGKECRRRGGNVIDY